MERPRSVTVLPNQDIWYGRDEERERADNISQDTRVVGNELERILAQEEAEDTIFPCPFCDLQFGDKSGFRKHVRKNHAMALADDAEKQRMAIEAEAAQAEMLRQESALSPAPEE